MKISLQAVRKRTAPWVGWLAIALLIFPMGRHAVGAVLCIETDGQITFEEAAGFSCSTSVRIATPNNASADTMRPADRSHTSHCGSCVDILLPGGGDEDCASLRAEPTRTAQVDLSIATILPAPLSTRAFSLSPLTPVRLLSPTSSTVSLRSVVLLI